MVSWSSNFKCEEIEYCSDLMSISVLNRFKGYHFKDMLKKSMYKVKLFEELSYRIKSTLIL